MRLFLNSHNLEPIHIERFRELIYAPKISKALFITAAASPYGFDPKPVWLSESLDDMRQFANTVHETSLEESELIPENLNQYGFIFVSGGNTFYLAYRLAQTGFDVKLTEYILNNGVYSGSSAGSIILMDNIEYFAEADDPKEAPKIYPGLNVISQAIIPHADSKKHGDIVNGIADTYRKHNYEVILLNDNQVFIVDGEITEVI